jgi:hypothetical protein
VEHGIRGGVSPSLPGCFQSKASYDHITTVQLPSSSRNWFNFLFVLPYGGRIVAGGKPTAAAMASLVRFICSNTAARGIFDSTGWFHTWFATSCPSRTARCRISACLSTLIPMTKNVTYAFKGFKMSINRGVNVPCGPSSNVNATRCRVTGRTEYTAGLSSRFRAVATVHATKRKRTRISAVGTRLTLPLLLPLRTAHRRT